jgi:hypothetical protein
MSVMFTNEDEERALQCSLHVVTEKVLYGQVCGASSQGKARPLTPVSTQTVAPNFITKKKVTLFTICS